MTRGLADRNNTAGGAASRAQVLSDRFGAMKKFGVTDALVAIDYGSCGASAKSDFTKPFGNCGLCVEEIERAKSEAWSESVIFGSRRTIE
jgi:hypothetical protein